MKKIFSLILAIFSSLAFAQMQTYKFENTIQYRIKSDFYSNFLNIFSTNDYKTHLMITQTPMGNISTLKVDDNMYSVYSEEKNPKVFKIDFEGTKDLLGNLFRITDNPSLINFDFKDEFVAKKTGKKETILNQQCDVYTITKKGDDTDEKDAEICIDTNSHINSVPFINSELNLKGLVYRVGQNIVLESIDTFDKWSKKVSEEEEINISSNDFTFQFDEKKELEEYKNEYKKQKQ